MLECDESGGILAIMENCIPASMSIMAYLDCIGTNCMFWQLFCMNFHGGLLVLSNRRGSKQNAVVCTWIKHWGPLGTAELETSFPETDMY